MQRQLSAFGNSLRQWWHTIKHSHSFILFCGLLWAVVIAGLYLRPPSFISAIERKLYDFVVHSSSRCGQSTHCVIVALDDKTLAEFGQWPWPRYRVALLLQKIRRLDPLSVGLDMMFPEADRTSPRVFKHEMRRDLKIDVDLKGLPETLMDYDRILATALAQGPFVLGVDCLFDRQHESAGCSLHPINVAVLGSADTQRPMLDMYDAKGVLCNISPLSRAVAHSGFLNVITDGDGLVRRAPLLIAYQGRIYPSLALAALAEAYQVNQFFLTQTADGADSLRFRNIHIPIDDRARFSLSYCNQKKRLPYLSAADVLNDRVSRAKVAGKIVFVGTPAAGLGDFVATPVAAALPGVELHATVVENILNQNFISRPDWLVALEFACIILLAGVVSMVVTWIGAFWSMVIAGGIGLGMWGAAVWAMESQGIYFSPLFPVMTVFTSFTLLVSVKFWREEHLKQYFRHAFAAASSKADYFRHAKEDADRASQYKSDFLSHMSHELRTPLNAILGISEVLSETSLTREQAQYTQMLYQSGELLLDIINNILDLSKIEAGQMRLESIPFDIRDLVEQTAQVVSVAAHQKGLQVAWRVAPAVPAALRGDPTRLRQILINLLGNGIKFTEAGYVSVNIDLDVEHQCPLQIAVQDSGVGISEEKQASVFAPFIQEDQSTTRKYGGTGLGLTICKHLVELMGGHIRIASRPHQGTTFTLKLPLNTESQDTVDSSLPLNPHFPGTVKGARILVADGHPLNQLANIEYIDHWGAHGYNLDGDRTLLPALVQAESDGKPFKIVLVDVGRLNMDEGSGDIDSNFFVLKQPPSFIVMGAKPALNNADRVRQIKMQYLARPIRRSQLFETLTHLLSPATPNRQHTPAHGSQTDGSLDVMRVLMAEDVAVNRRVVELFLKNTGAHLRSVENGLEAVEAYKQGTYDVILMDMEMPVMDGFDATRTIRHWEAEHNLSGVPIIALTAHAFEEKRLQCLAAGCTYFLTKPVKKKDLTVLLKFISNQDS